MSEKDKKSLAGDLLPPDESVVEFVLDDDRPGSSTVVMREAEPKHTSAPVVTDLTNPADSESKTVQPDETGTPVFNALASPKLPKLQKENRAKLLMQSPHRLFFYWSIKSNPFQVLNRALGNNTGSYTLVAKLVDIDRGREEIRQVDSEGNWWFDADADTNYRAEVGFYATNRPFVRVIYSNNVHTPRKSPSAHAASAADWKISREEFVQVLDVSGFSRDAYDVATAGDWVSAERSAQAVLSRFVDGSLAAILDIDDSEIRFALAALASGYTIEDLKWRISPRLFALLQANFERLTSSEVLAALRDEFAIRESELVVLEEVGSEVFGASLIGFPRKLKRRSLRPKLMPLSSLDARSFG